MVASSTMRGRGIDPQPPSALRVAGGAGPSATPALLIDVPHRIVAPASHTARRRTQRHASDLCRGSLAARPRQRIRCDVAAIVREIDHIVDDDRTLPVDVSDLLVLPQHSAGRRPDGRERVR